MKIIRGRWCDQITFDGEESWMDVFPPTPEDPHFTFGDSMNPGGTVEELEAFRDYLTTLIIAARLEQP